MITRTLLLIFAIALSTSSFSQYKLRKATASEKEGKCASCTQTIKSIPIDVTWDLVIKSNQIFFEISNAEYIDKLFPEGTDGLAVDFVTRDQYECGKLTKEPLFSGIKKGELLEPVYASTFKKQLTIEEGTGKGSFKLGTLPEGNDYELNLLFIKDRTVCYIHTDYAVGNQKWELLKMNLYMDTIYAVTAEKPVVKEVIKDLEKGFKFIIPFEKNKWEYKPEDIKPLYDSLRLTDYQIFSIDILAYSSVEGSTANNIKLQNKRAESIVAAMKTFQKEGITTTVKATENWVDFYNDLEEEKLTEYASLSQKELKTKLNTQGLSKELEYLLKNHRKAVITLDLKKRVKHLEIANETIITSFSKSIKDKDIGKALAYQQQLFERIGDYGVTENDINTLEIPDDSIFNAIRNNQLVFHYQQKKDAKHALKGLEEIYLNDPTNMAVLYNICALKVISWANGEMLMKPRKLKVDIIKLGKAGFDYKMQQRLLLNFHIVRASYSTQVENADEQSRSINFIKGKYRRIDCDDEDMVRVAKFLANYDKIEWAEDVLYRKAKKVDAQTDLIFYYLNLSLTNEANGNNERYKTIMLNAIAQDQERFCKMFSNYNEGGVTFQMLSNNYIKRFYCETCEGN